MMHQVLYNVHVTLFVGQLHNILRLVHHDMPCDPNLVSLAYTIPIFPSKLQIYLFVSCPFFAASSNYSCHRPIPMPKRANHVNIELEILHGNWTSSWKVQ